METTKHIIIVFALVLFVTGVSISEESKISNTRQAGCVIQIIIDSDIPLLSTTNIVGLMHSSGIMGKAIQEVLDSAPPDGVKIIIPPIDRTVEEKKITYKFDLNVNLSENVKPAANEFLRALVDNLEQSLHSAFATYNGQIETQLRYAQNQYKEAESQLETALKSGESKRLQKKYVITYSDLSEADKKVYKQLDQEVDSFKIKP